MSKQQIGTARHVPRDHHRRCSTGYIAVDPSLCEACADCVAVCRRGVLTVVGFLFHKHVKVDDPEQCRGCGKCAAVCPSGAIVLRERVGQGGAQSAPTAYRRCSEQGRHTGGLEA